MGELIATLFTKYERSFHDERLAALATRRAVETLLRDHVVRRHH